MIKFNDLSSFEGRLEVFAVDHFLLEGLEEQVGVHETVSLEDALLVADLFDVARHALVLRCVVGLPQGCLGDFLLIHCSL